MISPRGVEVSPALSIVESVVDIQSAVFWVICKQSSASYPTHAPYGDSVDSVCDISLRPPIGLPQLSQGGGLRRWPNRPFASGPSPPSEDRWRRV